MLPLKYVAVSALLAIAVAQDYEYEQPRPAPTRVQPGYSGPTSPKPTPVPILKQINRHNEDGSYTYGYEGADGSFKIETKLPTGEVRGKYGYVDDTGKVRVVEYGATKYGFEPSGEGITVAPPTLVDETTNKDGTLNPEYSGEYYDNQPQQQPPPFRAAPVARPQPRPQLAFENYSPPQQFSAVPQRPPAAVPPRVQIGGASLVSHQDFDFGPSPARSPARTFVPASRPSPAPYASPAPIQEEDNFEPAPIRSAPRITYAQPALTAARTSPLADFGPRPNAAGPKPAPHYAPRPSPVGARGGGILDQLSKDYALPQGGAAPLHDISFGYY